MEEDGTRFKVSYPFMPYFYVLTKRELIQEVSEFLVKKFSGAIGKIETVIKEDLDLVCILHFNKILVLYIIAIFLVLIAPHYLRLSV